MLRLYLIFDGKDKMQYELKKTPVKDLFIFCIDFCKEWEREKGRLLKTAIQNYGRFFKNTVSNYYDIIRMIQHSVTKNYSLFRLIYFVDSFCGFLTGTSSIESSPK